MTEKFFWRSLIAIAVLYWLAARVDVMDADASQYAAMSREMTETGQYLEIYEQGRDYLDKPPLLFWLSSLSMRIFGVSNFAYKTPSVLFALLAIFSTFRFALLYYKRQIAQYAALILASSQAFFLITNDVRTDTILTGCVAFAVWQLAAGFEKGRWLNFLGGFIGIGLGLLAKGPIALMVPALAFSAHFLYKKQYKNFFRLEYLWGLVVIGLILLPMCVGLYHQFDLHPEKVVNGRTGTSGLRFFFWTQSFGRITGENVWNNGVGFTFLFENMLWAFQPWVVLSIGGFFYALKSLLSKPKTAEQTIENQEIITLGGFILGYLMLGSSKYQLPHYLFVVYPFAAVITARFLDHILNEKPRSLLNQTFYAGHWLVVASLWAVPFLVMLFVFPSIGLLLSFITLLSAIFVINAFQKKNLVYSTIFTALTLNFFLTTYFYPRLLTYQWGSEVGKWAHAQKIPDNQFFTYQMELTSSLHYYARRTVKSKTLEEITVGDWIVTNEAGLAEIQTLHNNLKYIETGNHFTVSLLTREFLMEKTRQNVVGQYFLIRVLPPLPDEPIEGGEEDLEDEGEIDMEEK